MLTHVILLVSLYHHQNLFVNRLKIRPLTLERFWVDVREDVFVVEIASFHYVLLLGLIVVNLAVENQEIIEVEKLYGVKPVS